MLGCPFGISLEPNGEAINVAQKQQFALCHQVILQQHWQQFLLKVVMVPSCQGFKTLNLTHQLSLLPAE
jgi:hypothetical protein